MRKIFDEITEPLIGISLAMAMVTGFATFAPIFIYYMKTWWSFWLP